MTCRGLLAALLFSTSLLAQEADLLVEKLGPSEAAAGSNVAYTVTVTNAGPDAAATVTLSDPVPAGMSFVSATQDSGPTFVCSSAVACTIATLPAGGTATFTFVFDIVTGTQFTNVASVSSQTFDPNSENDTSTAFTIVTVPTGDLFLQKTAPVAVVPDSDLSFAITLTNGGPSAAENVLLTDNLPAPLTFVSFTQTSGPTMSCGTSTCTLASFPAGGVATFTLTGHVPAGTPAGTEINNQATVTSDNDPNEENNAASVTVTVATADVRVVKTGPPTATAGETITYDLTVTNDGPDPALNVVVTDTLLCASQNCTLGTLAPGASVVFNYSADIPSSATSWSNTVEVSTDSFDPNLANNTSTVPTAISQSADLTVTKSAPATVVATTDLSYSVTVTNDGPSDASGVVVTDTLPPGTTFVSSTCGSATCNAGTLAAGASTVLTFVVNVDLNAGSPLVNTVTVTASTPDPDPSDNSSTAQTAVTAAPADVSVTKSADFSQSLPGADATYTIVATNNGPGSAADVVVTDVLPAGTTLVSSSAGCTGTTTVVCTAGTLAAGNLATFTLVVTLPDTPGTVVNTASVRTASSDPASGNDSASAAITTSAQVPAIPALSPFSLVLLALGLGTVVLVILRSSP